MTNICQFCEKTYSSKSSLNKHQKTAKYCIKIQNELKDPDSPEIELNLFHCEYCGKNLTSKIRLQSHQESCINMYKHIISEKDLELNNNNLEKQKLKDRVIELEAENRLLREHSNNNQSTINEIAKQPRITTTNNNNKILITTPVDLSQPTVQQLIQNGFSDEYMIQGQKGIARFAYDNMLKDDQGKLKYICTDPSRLIFQYRNKEGEIQKDVKAKKLTKALLDGELKSASHKIASDKMAHNSEDFLDYSMYYLDIKEMEDDNSNFSKELSTLVI